MIEISGGNLVVADLRGLYQTVAAHAAGQPADHAHPARLDRAARIAAVSGRIDQFAFWEPLFSVTFSKCFTRFAKLNCSIPISRKACYP